MLDTAHTTDSFPGVREDCLALVGKCHLLILHAKQCHAACVGDDVPAIRCAMDSIKSDGADLARFARAFEFSHVDIGD